MLETFRGSGCDRVGRAVASDANGPWFKSNPRQFFLYIFVVTSLKIKVRKSRPRITPTIHLENKKVFVNKKRGNRTEKEI